MSSAADVLWMSVARGMRGVKLVEYTGCPAILLFLLFFKNPTLSYIS